MLSETESSHTIPQSDEQQLMIHDTNEPEQLFLFNNDLSISIIAHADNRRHNAKTIPQKAVPLNKPVWKLVLNLETTCIYQAIRGSIV